jgi:hypothetical protein
VVTSCTLQSRHVAFLSRLTGRFGCYHILGCFSLPEQFKKLAHLLGTQIRSLVVLPTAGEVLAVFADSASQHNLRQLHELRASLAVLIQLVGHFPVTPMPFRHFVDHTTSLSV